MSLDILVERFRVNAHLVHQGESGTESFKKASEAMDELWMQMNEEQRDRSLKGYEWMWSPPTERKIKTNS